MPSTEESPCFVSLASIVVASLLFSGCGIFGPQGCPDDLRWQVNPSSADLQVGDSVRVTARAFGCGGTEELPVDMRWSSSDETVVSVGERNGRVRGLAVGCAEVVGVDMGRYGIGPVTVEVDVRSN